MGSKQREIKFRAWDKNMGMSNPFTLKWLVNAQHGTDVSEYETIMQYTGLKDKNGVEIYEGDIVQCHIFVQELGENYGVMEGEREFVGTVSFDVTGFNIQANGFRDNPVFYEEFHEESLEVIGNVWENPNLLESKK